MASIFTYNDVSRVSSPWSTPGSSTPQTTEKVASSRQGSSKTVSPLHTSARDLGITKLEPEPQEGSTEYKLHLLLRPRRKFVSASTGSLVSGSQHSKIVQSPASVNVDVEAALMRQSYVPSMQTRQARLQQLTTQLLWRLQQSSPFHSSSVANLVLPLLPEATPKLGLPTRPAKVLPGLEESQGALYEIGVADDGTLVGLIDEELEESLTNLRAMAASLGCVVELQRKVVVGDCQWTEGDQDTTTTQPHAESLWVAEALVRPDMSSSKEEAFPGHSTPTEVFRPPADSEKPLSDTEQIRIAITGDSTAGKSSLLGVLTNSALDNGRGKSRLSLLKHRHEIASGVTSSVAQELIGYASPDREETPQVVNYASKDVSSWVDIHNLAQRLVFLSDSPGLSRYAKSAFRTLVSWEPQYTVFCVAADAPGINPSTPAAAVAHSPSTGLSPNPSGSTAYEEGLDTSFMHLDLCLKMDLPLLIAITKMDLATKSGLRGTLAKLLSILKGAGRKPILLSIPSIPGAAELHDPGDLGVGLQHILVSDTQEVEQLLSNHGTGIENMVPLVFTSAVTGAGISKLHALLRSLPYSGLLARDIPSIEPLESATHVTTSDLFHIDEVFMIPPSKVYSSTRTSMTHQGVVLCGFVKRGKISIGDDLMLGPYGLDSFPDSDRLHPSSSYNSKSSHVATSRSLPAEFCKSLQLETPATTGAGVSSSFIAVRVVSLRNLRLPVRSLLQGQVGTIGIEPLAESSLLQRTRKGMVLTAVAAATRLRTSVQSTDLPHPEPIATGYRVISASFPASSFTSPSSPPLILAGHALIYVNSVRAAAKVTAVALVDSGSTPSPNSDPSSPIEVFRFESESSDRGVDGTNGDGAEQLNEEGEIKITFRFVSSVEWMQLGDKLLVVPTASAPGPVAGPAVPSTGLNGFVGRICELTV